MLSIPVLFIISCKSGGLLMKLKEQESEGTVNIDDLQHSQGTDKLVSVQGSFGWTIGGQPKINVGLHSSFQKINTGDFKASIVNHFVTKSIFDDYKTSTPTVLKLKIGLEYEYPLIRKNKTKEKAVSLYDAKMPTSIFYTIMDVDYQNIWSLRGGVGHVYGDLKSETYAETLRGIHKDLRFDDSFEKGELRVSQGSYIGKIGVSFSKIFSTSFNAVSKDHDFTGALYRKMGFYGELQILAFSHTDLIEYHYLFLDDPMTAFEDKTDIVNPFDVLPRQSIGFSVGGFYRAFGTPASNLSMGGHIEIGTAPGYMDNLGQGFYFEVGIQIGFGSVKR